MEITARTRVFDILKEYGDIASVMGAMGIQSIGKYSLRRIITRFINVKTAARIHKVDLEEFLAKVNKAISAIKQ